MGSLLPKRCFKKHRKGQIVLVRRNLVRVSQSLLMHAQGLGLFALGMCV